MPTHDRPRKQLRLISLPEGTVDTEKHEISFVLDVDGNRPFSFVAKYGVAAQITSSLGKMVSELHEFLVATKGTESTAAEPVASFHVQKDQWSQEVLLMLMTPRGVPYTFALPHLAAVEIANQLKTQSGKATQTGTA